MSKRIIEIGTEGCYLKLKHQQLIIERNGELVGSIPIEDMSALIIDHPQTLITQPVLSELIESNVMVISSNARHQPIGMFLPLQSHTTQTERFSAQASMSTSLKKRLWQQLIQTKVHMQARVLKSLTQNDAGLSALAKKVRSGDPENIEAQAARRYWSRLFEQDSFKRDTAADDQNRFLNYGYAIVRAVTARAICATGLHPTIGLHHHNRYNAYCLADDLMEPYRPFVDLLTYEIVEKYGQDAEMEKTVRSELLQLLTWEINMGTEKLTFQGAIQKTAQSLCKAILGETRQLSLPHV